ncbi:MAG: 1-acyl-sn-glycerol-3-phosphate acyltransferase [Micavibrio aeruginosavorus]|uniref:1-acyl-sn-glycerol-3-phosphate acyltransferase n=1 Tax=Micavibrio aeruginosavorus TaxID=349221 RepID=A0A2W5FKA9_9BACT|nr:MAG: 1-acyl-sn-glycerol-3-phosphate acyltransferase [Micavibrio aeruginosavorus]
MRKLMALLKFAAMALVSIATIPFQALILLFAKGKASYFIPQFWHKMISCILGLETEFIGKPVAETQVFFVGNHLSHFDIFILGSRIRASFVAKDDLAKWPVIGFLCRLQQTAFISRSSGQASKARNNIRSMLDRGKNIILFPEGTSTRGETVLDFKSSLFSLPLEYAEKGVVIQPFTIKLIEVDGVPAQCTDLRDLYSWDRDNPIDMGPHIWNFAQTKGAKLQIIFHDPVMVQTGEDRKSLSQRLQEIVASPLVQSPAAV